VSNDVSSEYESVCNELVSGTAGAVTLSTVQQSMDYSSVHPQQDLDIQRRTTARGATRRGDLGGQLKVGP
jgi:hypothetical protein